MPFPSEEERVGLTCKLCSQVTGAEDMAYSLLAGGEVPWWVLLVATRSRAQGGEEGRSPSPCRAGRRSSEGKGRKGAMVLEWGGSVWPATASQEGHQEQGQYPGPPMGAGLSAHR